jgi:uncharacterized sodium:solute symporter family permease YidK
LGVSGLLIVSFFAAGMSTISTSFNSSATVIFTDHYQELLKRGVIENQLINFFRGIRGFKKVLSGLQTHQLRIAQRNASNPAD